MLSVGAEVEASATGAAAKGPAAAASPARRSGVRVGVAIFGGRHYFVSVGGMSGRFTFVMGSSRGEMYFVMVVVAASVCILYVSGYGTVGLMHRSRSGWGRGVAVVRMVRAMGDFRYVGWSRDIFSRYVFFHRGVFAKFRFQVGLVVGVC